MSTSDPTNGVGRHGDHEVTLAHLPPERVQEQALASGRIRGAFGYALVIERGPRAGGAYVLAPGITTVGRSPDSDLFLNDVTVSRRHGSFTAEDRDLRYEDHGSTNGTYVNGERVERAELAPGDELIIGKYHLIVARGDG